MVIIKKLFDIELLNGGVMRNIKLTIEYDGKEFNGWQKQPNKLNIQGTIEKAIEQITGEEVNLTASGRTDKGVHAIRTGS